MKILSREQIKEADYYTIEHEPITSIDLMERAAAQFVNKFVEFYSIEKNVHIVCGLGNNGGDGLAIARMLYQKGYEVSVSIIWYANQSTADFQENLKRLEHLIMPINCLSITDLHLQINSVLIDALFGVGLSRPLDKLAKQIVEKMNRSECEIVAVDIPSGLFADSLNSVNDCICKATHTFTFETPKQSFFYSQNENFLGNWCVLPIGLHRDFLLNVASKRFLLTQKIISKLVKPRSRFSHKGTFGFGLLVAGSFGMMGASLLAAKAALRSGIGKLVVAAPKIGYDILQVGVPEAMYLDRNSDFAINKYDAVGIGPGLGIEATTQADFFLILDQICRLNKLTIVDADGLNCLALKKEKLDALPSGTILTPHPKEFERLIGKKWKDEVELEKLLLEFCANYKVIVCLKGKYTRIVTAEGTLFYNSTGNAGMATAGSGDVLTGMILAFLAQGYSPINAAILGVFEHGKAGDRAAHKRSERSMIASDIVEEIR